MADTPNLLPIDVAGVVEAYRTYRARSEQNAVDMDRAYAEAQGAAAGAGGAAYAIGQATVDLNNVVETAAIKLKRDNAAAAAAFGVNPDANSYVITELGQKLRSGVSKEIQMAEALQADAATSFWDNPVDWLAAQVSMPFDAMGLEMQREGNDRIVANLMRLQNMTLDQHKVNAAINESASVERLAAKNKLALAQAAAAAAAAAADAKRLGIDRISMRVKMSQDQLQSAFQINNIFQAHNQAELQRVDAQLREEAGRRAQAELDRAARAEGRAEQAFELSLEHQRLINDKARADLENIRFLRQSEEQQRTLRDYQIKAAGEQEEAKKLIQDQLNIAAPLLNMRPMTTAQYLMLSENNPIKQALDKLMFSQDAAFRRLGSSPLDAVRALSAFPVPLPPGQELVRTEVTGVEQAVITANSVEWKSLGPDVQRVRLVAAINEHYKKILGNIPETGSIYSPPPLVSTTSMEALVNNPVVQELRAMAVTPEMATRVEDVLRVGMNIIRAQATAGRADQRVVAAVAEHIADFYKAIMVENNQIHQYRKFALPGMAESTTGFKISVGMPGLVPGMTTKQTVDFSNAAQVQAFLTKRMMRDDTIMRILQNTGSGIGVP